LGVGCDVIRARWFDRIIVLLNLSSSAKVYAAAIIHVQVILGFVSSLACRI